MPLDSTPGFAMVETTEEQSGGWVHITMAPCAPQTPILKLSVADPPHDSASDVLPFIPYGIA